MKHAVAVIDIWNCCMYL